MHSIEFSALYSSDTSSFESSELLGCERRLTVGVTKTLLASSLLLSDCLDQARRLARVAASVEVLGDDTELIVVAR